ncbi:MAG TPA: CAP domain-containing protein [Burkholderiaceae bacterium]|nr:CAP domain-containing protein [Burkholderiaceae bacterium]
MQRINAARAQARSCGSTAYPAAGALAWHEQLYAAAETHSTDMAAHDHFSHTGTNGSTLATRLTAAGYGFRTAGENIAFNYRSVADVMAGWLGSAGHCANIMDARFREVGVACIRNSRGEPYWTMDLGARS